MGLVGMLKATEDGPPGTAPSATSAPNPLLGKKYYFFTDNHAVENSLTMHSKLAAESMLAPDICFLSEVVCNV